MITLFLPYKIEGLLLEETEESGPVFVEIVPLTFVVRIPRSHPVSTLHAHRRHSSIAHSLRYCIKLFILLLQHPSLPPTGCYCSMHIPSKTLSFPTMKTCQRFTKRGSHHAAGRQQCRCRCWVTSWFPSCLYLHIHPWSMNSGTGYSRPGQREK